MREGEPDVIRGASAEAHTLGGGLFLGGVPLQLILYYIDDLIRQGLDVLPAQVDGEAWAEVVANSTGVGGLGLAFAQCSPHGLPREGDDPPRRRRSRRGERHV